MAPKDGLHQALGAEGGGSEPQSPSPSPSLASGNEKDRQQGSVTLAPGGVGGPSLLLGGVLQQALRQHQPHLIPTLDSITGELVRPRNLH